MIIRSRVPDPAEDEAIGRGGIKLAVTSEQLELIVSMLYIVRLGQGTPHSAAAFDLISDIEDTLGDTFMEGCYEAVNMNIVVQDTQGNVVVEVPAGSDEFDAMIEV